MLIFLFVTGLSFTTGLFIVQKLEEPCSRAKSYVESCKYKRHKKPTLFLYKHGRKIGVETSDYKAGIVDVYAPSQEWNKQSLSGKWRPDAD